MFDSPWPDELAIGIDPLPERTATVFATESIARAATMLNATRGPAVWIRDQSIAGT